MNRFSLPSRAFAATLLISALSLPAVADISGPLSDSIKNTMAAKSYHFAMIVHGQDVEGDVVNPGRYRTAVHGMQLIIVGDNSYMKMGSSAWKKTQFAGGLASMTADMMKHLELQQADFTSSDLGMRSVDGETLHAYSVHDIKRNKTETVYLDGSNRFARVDTGKVSMRFSRYDSGISIDPPI